MAAKKRKKKSKTIGNYDADGILCFTRDDLSLYELAQYRLQNTRQSVKIMRYEFNELQQAFQKRVERLSQKIVDQEALARQQKDDLQSLQDEMENKYKISMKDITYDDITGRIYVNDSPIVQGVESNGRT